MSVKEDSIQKSNSLQKLFQKVIDTDYENYKLKLENLELRLQIRMRDQLDAISKKYSSSVK